MQPVRPTGYRFDSFEVQLRSGVLLHKSFRVRIQRLPFQMLLMLLERPGDLVSREDLCAALWSKQTFLDFDNSLYVAAAKLREALGDDPAAPRYVKTVSRQGYQFVADVVPVAETEPAIAPGQELKPAPLVETAGAAAEPMMGVAGEFRPAIRPLEGPLAAESRQVRRGWSPAARWVAAAVLAVAAVCGGLSYRVLHRPLVSGNDRVVLGDVRNATGDSSLNDVLSPALRIKLQESPYLSLVDDPQFRRQSWSNNGSQASPAVSLQQGLKACTDLGAQLYLAGQIANRASGYRVEVDAWRCRDGHLMTTQSAEAASQTEILPALEAAASNMRRRLGESESSLQTFNTPLIQATTSSLAALKAFTRGETDYLQDRKPEAATHYKLAVDLDPQFALAYARLGSIYKNEQDGTLGQQYFQRAFELRERTTDREKLYIAAHYYSDVLGDMPRGIDAYQTWATLYPKDVIPVENLGNIFDWLGDPQKGLALERKALQMRPEGAIRYGLLATAEFSAGKYSELNVLCNDPKYARIDDMNLHYHCYLLAWEQNDRPAVERQLAWGHGKPDESILLEFVAWAEMSRGRLAEARRTFAQARDSATRNGLTDFVAELDQDEAWLDADLGLIGQARPLAAESLRLAPNRHDIEAFAALIFARCGDIARADTAIAHVSAQAPHNTVLVTGVLTAARAAEAMDRHDPKTAIRLLEQSRPMDNASSLALAPAYYRGLAYLDDHRYDDAAREFQQVLDHRVLMPESLYVALSQLELGHALQLAGRGEQAEKSDRALDGSWAAADPDFPALRQLRTFQKQADR